MPYRCCSHCSSSSPSCSFRAGECSEKGPGLQSARRWISFLNESFRATLRPIHLSRWTIRDCESMFTQDRMKVRFKEPTSLKPLPRVRRVPSAAAVTVVIPVLNESRTVAKVVKFARQDRRVAQVLVVDDGSIDGTPELAERAGAKVITSSMLGKGVSMED